MGIQNMFQLLKPISNEVGPKKEECEKGGGCGKGGCEAVSHLGAKKNFGRERPHPPL